MIGRIPVNGQILPAIIKQTPAPVTRSLCLPAAITLKSPIEKTSILNLSQTQHIS